MSKVDTRLLQVAKLMRVNDGMTMALNKIGEMADLPDPEANAQV